jgi:hypothetical protein
LGVQRFMEMTNTAVIRTADLVDRLLHHPLYAQISNADGVRLFMRYHVFCVWDFMTLLKTLQRGLTCVAVPWLPTADPLARRLVNAIVLDEESDADGGGYVSHFELYVAAMQDCGADTAPIERFLAALRAGLQVPDALVRAAIPEPAQNFVMATWTVATAGDLHEVCAAFSYGREDIIPDVFRQLVGRLAVQEPQRFARFRYYLERHIQADSDQHGPAARRLTERLCGGHATKLRQAESAARQALEARLRLWDALAQQLPTGT